MYASNVVKMRSPNFRFALFSRENLKYVIFRFSNEGVFKSTSNQQYIFKLFIVKNKSFRHARKVTLSVPVDETGQDIQLDIIPQLLKVSEATVRGTDCFVQWDITAYVQQHNCLPKELVATYTGSLIEFWPNDSMYSFFAPRIEISDSVSRKEVSRTEAELLTILIRNDYRGVIIYPPTIDWNVPLFQRPQQLMRFFAEEKYLCFYITANNRYDDYPDAFNKVNDYLYISYTSMNTFNVIPEPIVILSWAMNISYLQSLENYFLVYDYIDDVSIFHLYDQRMEAAHRYLLQNADVVVATAERLLNKAKKLRTDAVLCPNGVDFSLFSSDKGPSVVPGELRQIVHSGKQIVGYYGALARWVDYDLIRFLAKNRPDLEIVLIGMDYDGSLEKSGVAQLDNVTFLGHKHYSQLPNYLDFFDVAIIPFCINEITLGTNPIKMYEYMCAGKPVVTTNMPECVKASGVLVGKNKKHFVKLVDKALQLKKDKNYVKSLVAFAKLNTWENRVKIIRRLIEKKQRKSPGLN